MKTVQIALVLAELSLMGSVVAQQHRRHQHKRAIITATIWETVSAPDVVVYVDENGNLISSGGNLTPPTPAPAPVVVQAQAPAPAPPAPSPAPPAPKVEAPKVEVPKPAHASAAPKPVEAKPVPPPPAPPAPAPAPVPANVKDVQVSNSDNSENIDQGARAAYGITWTGYKGDESYSPCKTYEDADAEWAQMGAYGTVRTYGTDCDQPAIALKLAKKYNKKVFLGVYDITPDVLGANVKIIMDAARKNGGWGSIDTISIGNEDVNRGHMSPAGVIGAVNVARGMLHGAGYRGPVVHVDTQNAILDHPELCGHAAGDYIAANIHAFFNPNTPAERAGDFVAEQVEALRRCGASSWKRRSVRVRVTETGWPKQGEVNGQAVPGKSYQRAAIASIKNALSSDVFLFSAFNNYWMRNSAGTFNTEHYWGTLDD